MDKQMDEQTAQTEEAAALGRIRTKQLAPQLTKEQIAVRKALRLEAKTQRQALKDEKSAAWRGYRELVSILKSKNVSIGRELAVAIEATNKKIDSVYRDSITAEVQSGRAAIAVATLDARSQS
jgi:hypothetical protein